MTDALWSAVRLAEQVRLVLVEAAERTGLPRMAWARSLWTAQPDRVGLSDWYTPGAAEQLLAGAEVSIVVWDEKSGAGYQLRGHTEDADQGAGARRLYVRVEKVVSFGAEQALAACC